MPERACDARLVKREIASSARNPVLRAPRAADSRGGKSRLKRGRSRCSACGDRRRRSSDFRPLPFPVGEARLRRPAERPVVVRHRRAAIRLPSRRMQTHRFRPGRFLQIDRVRTARRRVRHEVRVFDPSDGPGRSRDGRAGRRRASATARRARRGLRSVPWTTATRRGAEPLSSLYQVDARRVAKKEVEGLIVSNAFAPTTGMFIGLARQVDRSLGPRSRDRGDQPGSGSPQRRTPPRRRRRKRGGFCWAPGCAATNASPPTGARRDLPGARRRATMPCFPSDRG